MKSICIRSVLTLSLACLLAHGSSAESFTLPQGDGTSATSAMGSIDQIRAKAEQGDADAQCTLGRCYETGKDVKLNLAEAAKWYRKAADQGHAVAQAALGDYYKSLGAEDRDAENLAEAAKWYRKAAEQGNSNGQFQLGYCYKTGRGVEINAAEAVLWLRKAAECNDPEMVTAAYKLLADEDLISQTVNLDNIPDPIYLAADIDVINLSPVKEISLFEIYLGMIDEGVQDVRTTLTDFVTNNRRPVVVTRSATGYYLVTPARKIYAKIFLNEYKRVSRISVDPAEFGVPKSDAGYDRDLARKKVTSRFKLAIDANGLCQYQGVQVEFSDAYVDFTRFPVTNDKAALRITEMRKYFAERFPLLSKNVFGVQLGESFQSVLNKLDAKGKPYVVKNLRLSSDNVGTPDKQISCDYTLADVDFVGYTQYIFFQDILVEVNSFNLSINLSEQLRQSYPGANRFIAKHNSASNPCEFAVSMDGHLVLISYVDTLHNSSMGLSYKYAGVSVARDRLEAKILAVVDKRIKDQTNKQLKKIDL